MIGSGDWRLERCGGGVLRWGRCGRWAAGSTGVALTTPRFPAAARALRRCRAALRAPCAVVGRVRLRDSGAA